MDRDLDRQGKHLRKQNGVIYVAANFLCTRFRIDPSFFSQVVESVELGSTAIVEGSQCWIDDALFYDLANSPELSPYFPEERQQAVLMLLGEFDARPEMAA